MKPTKLLIILVIALFIFFMLGGLASLADRNRYESRESGGGASGSQLIFPLDHPNHGEGGDDAAKEIENRQARQDEQGEEDGNEPDRPPKFDGKIDKETYLRMRDEVIELKRGV